MALDRYVWSEERGWEVGLKQLWEYLAQYCYFPRLFDQQVLVTAVKDGVGRLDAPFAYATGKGEDGHHTGLVFRELGNVYFDDRGTLVYPDHIVWPPEIKPQEIEKPSVIPAGGKGHTPGQEKPIDKPKPRQKVISRYYGRVGIDPQRVHKDTGLIVEEVIQRLTSQVGCEVQITIEINARRAQGFDEGTVRTISENSRTLKFEHYGFEEG